MAGPPKPDAPSPSAFPSATAWSVILGARDRTSPDWQSRMDLLVRSYWRPVRRYLIQRWNCSPTDADDLTQEFFARLFEDDLLDKASPERGRFRAFLKLELQDLVIDDLRRRTALKRGGKTKAVSIDRHAGGAADLEWPGLSPEDEFDRVWAAGVLSSAVEKLREALVAEGRDKVFQAYWSCSVASPPQTYRECALALGVSPNDVGNYVFRARDRLRQILGALIRDQVEHDDDVEQELGDLVRLLQQ